jgi:hypothetical protein
VIQDKKRSNGQHKTINQRGDLDQTSIGLFRQHAESKGRNASLDFTFVVMNRTGSFFRGAAKIPRWPVLAGISDLDWYHATTSPIASSFAIKSIFLVHIENNLDVDPNFRVVNGCLNDNIGVFVTLVLGTLANGVCFGSKNLLSKIP